MELKIDFSNKRAVAGAIALICLLALVLYLPGVIELTNPDVCTLNGVCLHEQRLAFLTNLVPIFVVGGVLVGALVFFFMTSKLEDKAKEAEKITQALVQFFNKEEKAVIQKILENKGMVLQSEISRIEGIGKLKSHRILQRLSDRGVIEIESHGKTNQVKLAKHLKEALVKP